MTSLLALICIVHYTYTHIYLDTYIGVFINMYKQYECDVGTIRNTRTLRTGQRGPYAESKFCTAHMYTYGKQISLVIKSPSSFTYHRPANRCY